MYGTVVRLNFGCMKRRDGEGRKREGEVRLWELPTLKAARTLAGKAGGITALAWSPREETLIVAGQNQRLSQWDTATGELRGEVELAAVDPAQAQLMVPKWAYSTSQPKK